MSSSVHLITVSVLVLLLIVQPSSPLPLRLSGVDKRLAHPGSADKRELVLCWVVQIHTHADCSCGTDYASHHQGVDDDGDGDDVSNLDDDGGDDDDLIGDEAGPRVSDEGGDGANNHVGDEVKEDGDNGSEEGCDGGNGGGCHGNNNAKGHNLSDRAFSGCCSGRQQIWEHVAALSEEVGLEINHSFGQFHDHFLLCHKHLNSSELMFPRNPPFAKSRSDTFVEIHRQHSDLKLNNRELYDRYRQEVEQRLSSHQEILWFAPEHVHRRHSRSIIPPRLDLEQLQLQTPVVQPSKAVKLNEFKEPELMTRGDSGHDLSGPALVYQADTLANRKLTSMDLLAYGLSESENLFHVIHDSKMLNSDRTSVNISPHLAGDKTSSFISKNSISYDNHLLKFVNTAEKSVSNEDGDKYVGAQTVPRSVKLKGLGVPSGRHKRSTSSQAAVIRFNDPAYPRQWHLRNMFNPKMDINVTGVWLHNYTGHGVTVSVVDDGIEWRNPDLMANYNSKGSWDMNDNDPDPSPDPKKVSNHHGTRCAGEISAVANNSVCGVGVSYGAQISGLRVLDGVMTDSLEAEAFNKKLDVNDIYSCSWGPDDDGKTVDGPHIMAAKAMKYGVDFGRQGFGSIFVVASGNGGESKDNCNFDGYANSIYTVTIGAVDEEGRMPYYAEECASMLGVTFSSGTKMDIVTTDWTSGNAQGCTDKHTGTSAAAPLAAAMIALMLEARPCLTWRDVQYIIILTGQEIDIDVAHWQKNGAGLSHSHKHGFGLLNAWRLVNAARVWEMVPWLTSYSYAHSQADQTIAKGPQAGLTITHTVTEADIRGLGLFVLENVQLTITLSHGCRGKIGVTLTSPAGTVSVIATPRPKDKSADGFKDWTFTTVRCWGEEPVGNWTVQIFDKDTMGEFDEGELKKWRLTLFGTPMTSREFGRRRKLLRSAMSGEFLSRNHSLPCPAPPKYQSAYVAVSDRTLKILILTGAFCLLMAVYETLEYIFCYNEEKKEAARNRKLARRAQQLANQATSPDNTSASSSPFPIGATNGSTSGNGVGAVEDDEEEDDIFDASESSRLLRSERRGNISGAGRIIPEVIPLSTINQQVLADTATSNGHLLKSSVGPDVLSGETSTLLNDEETS